MEEYNLEKQSISYLEPIINQTLEMIEIISKGEDFDANEVNELLKELQENFGEYIHMMSIETQDKILKIQDELLNLDNTYESINL
jgi:hypothetical protein